MKKGKKTKLPKIFVQIASYRDPECQHTIKDLFEKAKYPDRINIGICWQYIAEEDSDCFEVVTRPEQLRIIHVDARQSKGACWARAQVQKLWQKEEYTLQIDSHMRFEKNWDETLINMLAECDSKKPVLSTYPGSYTPPNIIHGKPVTVLRADKFDDNGMLVFLANNVGEKDIPKKPIQGAFFSGNFCFASSDIIKEIPYDPNLYFIGEEISISARLWTKGWDIFNPNKSIIYHYYERTGRTKHWDDHTNWWKINDKSYKRLKHIFGIEVSKNKKITKNLNIYGLGKARSLAAYQLYAGIDFKKKVVLDNAKKGVFGKNTKQSFKDFIKNLPPPTPAPRTEMDEAWVKWTSENLAAGCDAVEIMNILIKANFTAESITREMSKHFNLAH